MKILAIAGSNAEHSSNLKLLQFMQRHFAKTVEIDVRDVKGIPMFCEDAEFPKAVTELGQAIKAADALVFSTPEEQNSVPSSLKSVLEWLSYHCDALRGKPVGIISASTQPQGGVRAQNRLRTILTSNGLDCLMFNGAEYALGEANYAFDNQGNLKSPGSVKALDNYLATFMTWVQAQK
ncbi:MAG: NAD(P)H-dependent oxidoreductase [Lactobacillus sp.]|jgi:NAD(P)H-dependent FMN reductase|nr:NAD(P)H-dependent oxidoreductase [Lactobacillus sp.]